MSLITDLHVREKTEPQTGINYSRLNPPSTAVAECGNVDYSVIYGRFQLTSVNSTPRFVRDTLRSRGYKLDGDDGMPATFASMSAITSIQIHIKSEMGW